MQNPFSFFACLPARGVKKKKGRSQLACKPLDSFIRGEAGGRGGRLEEAVCP